MPRQVPVPLLVKRHFERKAEQIMDRLPVIITDDRQADQLKRLIYCNLLAAWRHGR